MLLWARQLGDVCDFRYHGATLEAVCFCCCSSCCICRRVLAFLIRLDADLVPSHSDRSRRREREPKEHVSRGWKSGRQVWKSKSAMDVHICQPSSRPAPEAVYPSCNEENGCPICRFARGLASCTQRPPPTDTHVDTLLPSHLNTPYIHIIHAYI